VVAGNDHEKGVSKADYEQFRNKLIDSLYSVISPATGKPVATRIWTKEEAFDGPYMDLAPDLTLALKDGGLVSILASDLPVKLRSEPRGTHRPEGVVLARGPGVRQGVTLPQLSILDVAPILLYALGIPIPQDMEGRMPEEVFEASMLKLRPVRVGGRSESVSPAGRGTTERIVFDAEAEAKMVAQLRALGYVE
jgi:predicted AlkP superfamily phosphohydrolase/phosphomutase